MKKLIILILFIVLSIKSNAQQWQIQRTTATSGTVTAQDTQQNVQIIHDAGVTVSLTIAFPSNPFNGQMIFISSAGGITTLSLTTVVGTISNALTTLGVGGNGRYIYISSESKWFRI